MTIRNGITTWANVPQVGDPKNAVPGFICTLDHIERAMDLVVAAQRKRGCIVGLSTQQAITKVLADRLVGVNTTWDLLLMQVQQRLPLPR